MTTPIKILLVCLSIVAVAPPLEVFSQDGNLSRAPQTSNAARQIERAFKAARKGDNQGVSDLVSLGKKIIPHIEPYLFDKDRSIRRDALMLLKSAGGKESLPLMAKALGDDDLFARTAELLYEDYEPALLAGSKQIRAALLKSFSEGRVSTAGILLFGNYPGKDSVTALIAAKKKNGNAAGETLKYFPAVSYSLAANVALAQIGGEEGIRDLSAAIENLSPDEMRFVLQSVELVENTEVLRRIKNVSLTDNRIYQNGMSEAVVVKPDSTTKFQMSESRLRDFATRVFIEKFQLQVNFDVSKNRFSDAEIAEVYNKLDIILASK